MAISRDTVESCLNWDDCDIRTLLYIISLEGASDDEPWETDLVNNIILKMGEEVAKNQGDAEEYAIDLNTALEQIHIANQAIASRTTRKRAGKTCVKKV